MTDTTHNPGPWRVLDVLTELEIVTDRPTANLTESIVQFKGQANARPNARLMAAAPAQAIILELVQRGLMTLKPGEAEFDGVMYWFDARQPDWCKGVVDAIGWDTARAAVAQATS
jgi:hypothetical protein